MQSDKYYYVYILTNKNNTVLYTGTTNDIQRRMHEHKNQIVKGFTSKYNLNKLVFVQSFTTSSEAIQSEKIIKGWTRKKKILLIKTINPNFEEIQLS